MISTLNGAAMRAAVARTATMPTTKPAMMAARRVVPLAPAKMSRTFTATGLQYSVSKRFTAEHEWVSYDTDTNIGSIGITNYAQKNLGDVVYVELPKEGSELKQGEQIGAVESVKAASDIYSPISGVVEGVNEELGSQPALLNKSPEDKGWLCKVRLTNPSEFDALLNEEAYKAKCES